MGFWEWFKSVVTGRPYIGGTVCPRCGFSYLWDGRRCGHCNFPNQRGYTGPDANWGHDRGGHRPQQPVAPIAVQRQQPARPDVRVVPVEGLEAAQFTPISSDEARATIASMGSSWKSAYFDSTRVIPDARLPRIQIIDRAMVGIGLITPEELERIHKIGLEMGELRGEIGHAAAAARQAAEQAVRQSREQREAIRQQKRAEAEQRRRVRAEQIAQHRRTDIVYLGRGVSSGLADRRANVEKLQAAGLPVLATPADLASALDLSIPRLRWLAFHSEASPVTHYVRFTVPKKSGGQRALFAPHDLIAAVQIWILQNILAKVPVHSAAHGFVPGRSTVTNAAEHVGRDVLLNCDLTDFFPTVTFPRVRGIFAGLGYSPAVATILALLCTECPRREVDYAGKRLHVAMGPRALPQGACTSPALSNLVARRLDARLSGLARRMGWTYTRYADDLSLSAEGEQAARVGYVLARVRHIAADEGFAVNETKTRVLRPHTRQEVTGIVVNERAGVPRRVVRRIRAILANARHEGLAAQNRENLPHFESWLRGMIAYIRMVNPAQGTPLADAYARLGTRD